MHTLTCIGPHSPWIGGRLYNYTAGDTLVLSEEHSRSLRAKYGDKWLLVATDVEADSSLATTAPIDVDMSTTDQAFMGPVKSDGENYTPGVNNGQEDPLKSIYGELGRQSGLFMEEMFKVQVMPDPEAPKIEVMPDEVESSVIDKKTKTAAKPTAPTKPSISVT